MQITDDLSPGLLQVVVFAVSWLPFHAFQLAIDIDHSVLDMKDFRLLYTVFHIVAMCSTFANPLVYGWMNRNYRSAFVAVFSCKERLDSLHMEGQAAPAVRSKPKKALEAQDMVTTHLNATDVWGDNSKLSNY